ncbi:MAG: FHIPEP family type III secretion protein [Gammaproteobacteria bacterium]|nr:FHIPEP family type III secretion protein [Gammaproteobacteria bacterium]
MDFQAYFQDVSNSPSSWLSRTSDLMLAFVVIAIIALMILPLPLILLDTLVALNIALGIMLVLMGIYVSSSLQFSAFPSVLLISTLFRLALSVATTRMILLHGDAGNIINTFGSLVAGGNIVVGLVVFLIITLVQFLVIAKGAERVAEVGARFTLDAMPGKQMSIDSDLRSGLIDKAEARRKRHELELESKLHGSMDGAMKFVKGDAIAGIVIIIINLLGGLAIGVFQLGMDAGNAMAKYSILTIGDGMVAQIPALLGAMSAGLIVTRVTDSEQDKHLGDSIQKQFAAIPRVLLVAGAICFLLAAVPGFPTGVFVGLGLVLALLGASLVPALRRRMEKMSQPTFETVLSRRENNRPSVKETGTVPVQQAVPLLLDLPRQYAENGQDQILADKLDDMLENIQTTIGLQLPRIKFHWHPEADQKWFLNVFEVPVTRGMLGPDSSPTELTALIRAALRRNLTLFVGIQETSSLLTQASAEYPDIVKESLRSLPMQNVAAILRLLVEEEVSIRNIRGILEALVDASQHEKDVQNLTEFARIALARQICFQAAPDNKLRVVAVTPELEEMLLESLRASGNNRQLSLDPATTEQLRKLLNDSIGRNQPDAVIAHLQLRRQIRTLIQAQSFDTPVLSYNELLGHVELDVLDRVALEKPRELEIA